MEAFAVSTRSAVEITRVDDLGAFLDFPRAIYAHDPAWVPPLRAWLRRRLSPKNPFLKKAEIVLFVARRDGEIVGTISALHDRQHIEHKQESVAFFGFFECIDDLEVAAALLDAATAQARTWGASLLRGPRNLSRVEEVGVTVEGFDRRPPMLAGHHPAYYQRLLEQLGFRKHHDVLAYDAELYETDASGARVLRPIPEKFLARATVPGVTIQSVRMRTLSRDLDRAHHVFVEAFRDVPDNTPMPREQFKAMGMGFLFLSNPNMMQIATVGDQAVGFALSFPELNEAIACNDGSLGPAGIARLFAGRKNIRTASFKLLGVLPEYRRSGLSAALIVASMRGIVEAGYERLEGSLVDERNNKMRNVAEHAGMKIYKRYRIYEREV